MRGKGLELGALESKVGVEVSEERLLESTSMHYMGNFSKWGGGRGVLN